jgi:alpha-beta hydrolase superfamily lysophospholipase
MSAAATAFLSNGDITIGTWPVEPGSCGTKITIGSFGSVFDKLLGLPGHASQREIVQMESTSATTSYHRVRVDGVGIFYREAGPKNAPTIVLLHGFPSSSREFDSLIPLLATRYHVVAPDFPGFGHSDAPPPSSYAYTFDHLAEMTNSFLGQLKIERCIFFLHDYGGPVGFRIMLAHPECVQALIIQNANVYQEGLGAKSPTQNFVKDCRAFAA